MTTHDLTALCERLRERDPLKLNITEALTEAAAAIERLVAALEPFAKAADKLDGLWDEEDWRWNDSVRSNVTVRDIRRARTALEGASDAS